MQKIRDSDRDVADNFRHIKIYIFIKKYGTEIHDQNMRFLKTLSLNRLRALFPRIDDRSKLFSRTFLTSSSSRKCPLSFSMCTSYKWYLFVESNYSNYLSMVFVRRIEFSELFFMIYNHCLYDWILKRIEDPRVIHHQNTMIYDSCSISIRSLKTYW